MPNKFLLIEWYVAGPTLLCQSVKGMAGEQLLARPVL